MTTVPVVGVIVGVALGTKGVDVRVGGTLVAVGPPAGDVAVGGRLVAVGPLEVDVAVGVAVGGTLVAVGIFEVAVKVGGMVGVKVGTTGPYCAWKLYEPAGRLMKAVGTPFTLICWNAAGEPLASTPVSA